MHLFLLGTIVEESRADKVQLIAKGYHVINTINENKLHESKRTAHRLCPHCKTSSLYWQIGMRNDAYLCETCNHKLVWHKETIDKYPTVDYAAEDQALLKDLMNNDFILYCKSCVMNANDPFCNECKQNHKDIKYDSGVVVVVLDSAYFRDTNSIDQISTFYRDSAFIPIIKFCSEQHILVIGFKTALKPQDQWAAEALE